MQRAALSLIFIGALAASGTALFDVSAATVSGSAGDGASRLTPPAQAARKKQISKLPAGISAAAAVMAGPR